MTELDRAAHHRDTIGRALAALPSTEQLHHAVQTAATPEALVLAEAAYDARRLAVRALKEATARWRALRVAAQG